MKDQDQTKRQLISELTELRQRIAELEALGSECKETGGGATARSGLC